MSPDVPTPDSPNDDRGDLLADEAAALDDFLGGFPGGGEPSSTASADPEEMAATLDLILRLRQTAAAEGAGMRMPTPDVPASIGRYQLVAVAGQGGFAVVWEAVDPLLRRRVAVKVRQPDALLSPSLRRRFLREAEIASRLVHPHIVTIHEVGEEGGREYIVEEFCGGGSLAAWLARHPGPLSPRTAARLVQTLAEATAYAHGQGVIHRDIKPANVLLTEAAQADDVILSDRQTVKLADFGLGTLQDEVSDLTQLTASGSRLGTPAWMAPEQIDRSFGVVGPATDVHALGLLLQRLLTGSSPHDGRTDVEIYRSVLLDEPVSPDRLVKGVSRDLAAVCAACLAKRPTDRYASAANMAADLQRFLAGKPTVARPLSPAARLGRMLARRRMVAGLTLGLLVAVLGLAWSSRAWLTEGRAARVHREEIREKTAAAELQRAFEAWRTGNVSRALEHAAEVRSLSPALGDSLAGRWLGQRLHGERRMLFTPPAASGTPPAAHTVAVSPDGRLVAAGFADGTLRLIDTARNRTAEANGAHDEINDVCFSPDGQRLATAGQDGRCRWWRITDAGEIAAAGTTAAGSALYGVAFLADGVHLATGGDDRVVRVIDTTHGLIRRSIPLSITEGEPGEIEALALVSGGTVAVACGDHVLIIDGQSDSPPRELEHKREHRQPPVFHSLAVSPDGTFVAVGTSGRRVPIWSLDDGRLARVLPEQPAWVYGCGFSGDGRLLATACRDGMIRLFHVTTATAGSTLQGHVGRVWDVAFDPRGGVVSAGGDGTVREWATDRGAEFNGITQVPVDGTDFGFVRILPAATGEERRLLLAGAHQPPIVVRHRDQSSNPASSQRVADEFEIDRDRTLNGFAIDARGIRFAASFWRRPFAVGSIESDSVASAVDLPAASPIVGVAAWTPDGRLVTVASEDTVMLWPQDLRAATNLAPIDWHVSAAEAAPAGSPRVAVAGRRLVIVPIPSSGGPMTAAGTPLDIPIADSLNCIAWSPDGRQLLCGSRNGEAAVYDTASGARVGALVPHAREVVAAAWSPDGRVLLTADDNGMRLSDAKTLAVYDEVRPGWTITDIAIAPAGDLVAIAGKEPADASGRTGRLATLALPAP